jgi:3-methyladenine DNA glycosylase Mpg
MKGRSAKETIKEGPGDKIILIKKTLGENQEKIVDLLLQNREGLTQKQIQHRLGIPRQHSQEHRFVV